MNICIFEPFRAYRLKVGVDQKILVDMSCFWRTKIVCFTSFKDEFNPRKWKKSLKLQNFEVVNSAICAIFTLCHCKNLMKALKWWSDFPPEKCYFEIFSKTNAVSITFGLRYIHGQSLKEIDFPTRNAVDRFEGDSLYFMIMTVCAAIYFHNSLGPVCLIFSLQGLKCKLNLSLILAIFNIPVIPSPFTL